MGIILWFCRAGWFYAPGVALVLGAELAARVVGRGQVPRRSYGLGVLLGLREVYRDVELAVLGVRLPLDVLCYAVAADVVRVLAEGVIPVRRGLGALFIEGVELFNDLRRARREPAHELAVHEGRGRRRSPPRARRAHGRRPRSVPSTAARSISPSTGPGSSQPSSPSASRMLLTAQVYSQPAMSPLSSA